MAEPTEPVDDEPVRRYLRALTESGPRPADEVSAGARYKRYLDTNRYVLPWTSALPTGTADTATPTGPGGAELLGALLVDLLGIVRLIWSLPIEATGRVSAGPPRLLLGRPAPSGGALHPIEAYLGCGGGVGPPAGLYHYDPVHHALVRVRADDHRAALVGTLAAPPTAVPDVVLVLTAVFTRTMARYGDFGYRLQCQETGILLAQALAVAQRLRLPASAHLRFAGTDADRLLGLDGSREGVLAMLGLTMPEPGLPDPTEPTVPTAAELAGRPAAAEARPPDPMPAGLPAAVLHRAGRDGAVRTGGPAPTDQAAPKPA
ncbi:SagB family peptide dehydrogenase, partial [Plantactinospora sp. S1510]